MAQVECFPHISDEHSYAIESRVKYPPNNETVRFPLPTVKLIEITASGLTHSVSSDFVGPLSVGPWLLNKFNFHHTLLQHTGQNAFFFLKNFGEAEVFWNVKVPAPGSTQQSASMNFVAESLLSAAGAASDHIITNRIYNEKGLVVLSKSYTARSLSRTHDFEVHWRQYHQNLSASDEDVFEDMRHRPMSWDCFPHRGVPTLEDMLSEGSSGAISPWLLKRFKFTAIVLGIVSLVSIYGAGWAMWRCCKNVGCLIKADKVEEHEVVPLNPSKAQSTGSPGHCEMRDLRD
eukprot:GHVN01057852.1.p1 GENE.GHVN01057852.1~~GHVN01057852.1.p1  ORF type:complete len:289 (-),score=24.06 GHVN01057852.1:1961-2827(-)